MTTSGAWSFGGNEERRKFWCSHGCRLAVTGIPESHSPKNTIPVVQRSHSSWIHCSHTSEWRVVASWTKPCCHFGLHSLYCSPGVAIDSRTREPGVEHLFIWPHSPKDHGNIIHTVANGSFPIGLMSERTWLGRIQEGFEKCIYMCIHSKCRWKFDSLETWLKSDKMW